MAWRTATNLVGNRYGKLTVLCRVENYKNGASQWLCRCECGVEKIYVASCLKRGGAKSCGCSIKQYISEANTKHGDYRGGETHKGMGGVGRNA